MLTGKDSLPPAYQQICSHWQNNDLANTNALVNLFLPQKVFSLNRE